MSFLKFILKNPFRRKTSAFLAIVGIAIGIIVIVALGGITDGLVNTFEDTIHAGGADFQISGKETGDSAYEQTQLMHHGQIKYQMFQVLKKHFQFMLSSRQLVMII